MDYSKNQYEIVDPFENDTRLRELGAFITKPKTTPCRQVAGSISDYNYLVIDQDLAVHSVDSLFEAENQQIIIIINDEIPLNGNFRIVFERILKYIAVRTPEFLRATLGGLYQNIKYEDFSFDPLPVPPTEPKPEDEDGVERRWYALDVWNDLFLWSE